MCCALAWLRSYLADRSFSVSYGELASSSTSLRCGVPQGSVLGPLLLTKYTAELESVIRAHGPDQTECLSVRISNSVNAISDWMFSRSLQLNASKTEMMWCSSGRRAPELSFKSVICSDLIQPEQSVRNL